MSADVTARLEAVAARLERVAAKLGGGGGGGDGDDDIPMYVTDYENIVKNEVKAAIDACEKLGLKGCSEPLKSAYDNNLDLIRRSVNAKKPSPQDLMQFLKPGVDAIGALDKIRYKGYGGNSKTLRKWGDHYKAMYEAVLIVSWVTMSPPNGLPLNHVKGQVQSCEFNMMRALKNDKSAELKAWKLAVNKLNKKVQSFINEYFKTTGLTYNAKGGSLSDAKAATGGGGDDEKSAPKTVKKTAPKKAAGGGGGGGGMAALFGEINKGTKITKGMKKVTKDMKTKNRKERSGKVTMKSKKSKSRKKFGPPLTKLQGGRYIVENYDEGLITVDKGTIKNNVFVTTCDNATINVTTKVKAVTIDNCVKCRIYLTEVVSTVEMVNCKSTKIFVQGKAPSIAIDKCESPSIILFKVAFENKPDIITSNVSAMNVEIPGKTENDDNQEFPVPEQFITRIDPETRKMTTTATEH